MKAAFRSQYGTADVLKIEELETPRPKPNEVLVRVYAATVNRTDCHILTGKPLLMRLFVGLPKPRLQTTGTDFTGEVRAIGEHVQSFKVGDKVMGFDDLGCSSHSQYLCFRENKGIALMPANLDFDEAAACIEGAFYAREAIKYLTLNSNHTALVIGATGAIGSATVQYLSNRGTNVTAVCRGQHSELVRSIGANRVIDYEKENFINEKESYDFIFDAAGIFTFGQCKHLLKTKGEFTSSGGNINHVLLAMITPMLGGKKVLFRVPRKIKENLNIIRSLIEKGNFKPVIDRKYPLENIREAFNYVATGQKIGNVILTIGD